jgi:hypothetical protein
MNEGDYLAERFEEHRTHLRAVAYRMLGSLSEVDDSCVGLRKGRSARSGPRQGLLKICEPTVDTNFSIWKAVACMRAAAVQGRPLRNGSHFWTRSSRSARFGAKKRLRASVVSCGASSGKECPASSGWP